MDRRTSSKPEAVRTETNKDMGTEFAFFGEVWTFFKKYYFPRPDESYWSDLVEESAQINEKYHCDLCRDLLIAVVKELQRREKEMENRKENDGI